MKKSILISISLLFLIANVQAIKVKFTVANMSVNTAEGSMGIFTSFKVFPNDYSNPDSLELIDIPSINYNDISEVVIEEIRLSEQSKTSFSQTAVFPVTNTSTFGNKTNTDFIQGNSYVFRLSVMTKSGQQLNLMNKSATTEIANPKMNCAKLNNVYRKACHNCFQESIVEPSEGGFYQALYYTRVVEVDIHKPRHSTNYLGHWEVRHKGFGNKNNCGGAIGEQNKDFGSCLNDIVAWHNINPNHDVIILHIDLKSDFQPGNSPQDLDDFLVQIFNSPEIYKPKDFLGNFNDMRVAAQQNNWPSMGDLTGKFIFVLTGKDSRLNDYMSQRTTSNAIAFCAASVTSENDVTNLSGFSSSLRKNIIFYNMQQANRIPFTGDDADFNTGYHTSALGYINRTYIIGTVGRPGNYDNSEYTHALNFQMNNVAVANIKSTFNSTYPDHGIQWKPTVENAYLNNTHIYSSFANVTQAATQTITASNLVVEPGANFRMIAGESITLLPGTELKAGSNVELRIDNCSYADYSLRPSATVEQLTQEQIDALMHELNKDLYTYTPENEKEIVRLNVYPNPTSEIINVSYTNYLLNEAIFTLYDLTGRVVSTKTYFPKNEGMQQFSLNTKTLKNGTYFYTLQVGEKIHNGKVVKID